MNAKFEKKRKLRIIIITQGVSRVVKPMLNIEHEIVGLAESATRNYNNSNIISKILNFSKRILIEFLKESISLRVLAKKHKIPYYYIKNSSDIKFENWARTLKPDLIVVYSMSQLLNKNILDIPLDGTINLHPSRLPFYRGPNPDFWQYYDQVLKTGVTVHYLDEGEDTGDIIYFEEVELELGIKSPARDDFLIGKVGTALLIKSVNEIAAGIAPRTKQPELKNKKRARNLKEDEHKHLINWKEWPIERIWNILRGTEQWLDAIEQPKGLYKYQRWIVEGYEKSVNSINENPGTIEKFENGFYLKCRDGIIFLSLRFSFLKLLIGLSRKIK